MDATVNVSNGLQVLFQQALAGFGWQRGCFSQRAESGVWFPDLRRWEAESGSGVVGVEGNPAFWPSKLWGDSTEIHFEFIKSAGCALQNADHATVVCFTSFGPARRHSDE